MNPLHIGERLPPAGYQRGEPFYLPAQVVTKTIAILGLRGSGKSNTATVLVEEMLDQNLPPVIIDPTDAWWGLRSKYPVIIFGGSHGDVPLQESDGKTIAEFVVNEKVPVVLSLRHLRKGGQRRFVREFCEEIYHLKGKDGNRTSLTIVIDEAPLFVPQKVMGEMAFVVSAVEDLIARGRNAGFGVVLISQRSATINKDVLTQSDVIITHRLTSPQDKKALAEWFEDNASTDKLKEILASLSGLPDGRAWVWAPTLKIMEQVQMRRRSTFDSSATPELGKAMTPPKKLTEVNLDILREKMAATLEKAKSDDPKALRAEIQRLNAELAKKPAVSKIVKEITEVPVISHEQAMQIKTLAMDARELASKSELLWNTALEMERNMGKLKVVKGEPKIIVIDHPETDQPVRFLQPPAHPMDRYTTPPDGSIGTGGVRRMMIAIAQRPGINRRQLGVRAGLSSSSGSFSTYLSKMRSNGWLEDYSIGDFRLTPKGIGALGTYEPLPTGKALLDHWLNELGDGGARRILQVLADNYPHFVARQEVGRLSGLAHESGSFSTYLSKLRTLELIEGKTALKAADEFFT